jgi:hypothetical protein
VSDILISATKVHSREWRECCQCGKQIHKGAECVSLYGSAHRSEKPFRLWAHECCLSDKSREALVMGNLRKLRKKIERHLAKATL